MNSSVTWLGEACSSCEMAGRIGSTRPMPMNETTHANATAKTAFGWRNGLAAVAPCALLMMVPHSWWEMACDAVQVQWRGVVPPGPARVSITGSAAASARCSSGVSRASRPASRPARTARRRASIAWPASVIG